MAWKTLTEVSEEQEDEIRESLLLDSYISLRRTYGNKIDTLPGCYEIVEGMILRGIKLSHPDYKLMKNKFECLLLEAEESGLDVEGYREDFRRILRKREAARKNHCPVARPKPKQKSETLTMSEYQRTEDDSAAYPGRRKIIREIQRKHLQEVVERKSAESSPMVFHIYNSHGEFRDEVSV